MNKKLTLLLALLLALTLGLAGCKGKEVIKEEESNVTGKQENEVQEITLIDNVGREVILPYPVETAVVANRYNSELIRASGAIDKVIAVDTNTAQDREYWAQFDPNNVIGKGQSELNYEKIIELKLQDIKNKKL